MKFPRGHIFWEAIVGPYLDPKDMAKLELAADNHSIRRDLSLQPSSAVQIPSPYEDVVFIDYDEPLIIKSKKMMNWFQTRRLKAKNVILKYDPTFRVEGTSVTYGHTEQMYHDEAVQELLAIQISRMNESDRTTSQQWDFFNYIVNLSISVSMIRSYQLFHRLKAIESISFDCPLPYIDRVIDDFIHTLPFQNGDGSGSKISSISFSESTVSLTSVEKLIQHLPNISSLKLFSAKGLSDKTLDIISSGWRGIKILKIGGAHISDRGLESFVNKQFIFKTLSISGCPGLTYDGVRLLLSHSFNTITELRLARMVFTLEEAKGIVTNCPDLRILELSQLSNVLYCDDILGLVSAKCPKMKTLILPRYEGRYTQSDSIMTLTKGCKDLEIIYLGRIPNLTQANIRRLATAYSHSLREITLSRSTTMEPDLTPFFDCKRKVKININSSFE